MSHEESHSEILLRNGARQTDLVEVTLEQDVGLMMILSEESIQGQHVTMEAEAGGLRALRIAAYDGILAREQAQP